ncbi:MAG: beta-glucosidase, partial [Firmicutes bacterium]|nr:beta-glucosidase [Bacillota bacterium]
TMFPAMINAAATFNPELVEEMSSVISAESRAVGIRQGLSPVIDIAREPRWGRVYETFGEDPYLVSQMGISYVKGMQKK